MSRFEEMKHHLLAHNPGFDPVYFTTKFLDGLHYEIRVGVVLHRPKDLDYATIGLATATAWFRRSGHMQTESGEGTGRGESSEAQREWEGK